LQKHLGIILICLAFWMQGLFYDWETSMFFMILAAFAVIILLSTKGISVKVTVFEAISFGLYASGFLVHALWSGTDAAQAAFLQVVSIGLFVVLLGKQLETQHDVKNWYAAVYWLIITVVLYGWLIKGEGLLESVFGYANMVAALCLFALPIGIYSWSRSTGRAKWLYFASGMVLVLSLAATQARIAWALAAFRTVVYFAHAVREMNRKRLFTLLITVAAIGCVVILVLPFALPGFWQSLIQTSSLRLRLTYGWDAIRLLLHYPVMGVGPGAWDHLQYQYQTALYHVKHVHNHLLQIWLEGGLLSLLGFIGFLLIVVKDGIKLSTRSGPPSFVFSVWLATASVLAYGFWDFVLSFPALFMAVCAYSLARNRFLLEENRYPLSFERFSIRLAVILLLSIGVGQAIREINSQWMQSALAQGELRTVLAWEKRPSWVLPSEARNYLLGTAYSEQAKVLGRKMIGNEPHSTFGAGSRKIRLIFACTRRICTPISSLDNMRKVPILHLNWCNGSQA
jgi:O-antigen ligase